MFPIASQVVTNSAYVAFNNIPTTFAHLQLRVSAVNPPTGNVIINYATAGGAIDYGTNYRFHYLTGNGTSATSGDSGANATAAVGGYVGSQAASTPFVMVVDLLDYLNTSKNKVSRSLSGYDLNGSGIVSLYSGLWLNTGAVTGIAVGFNGSVSTIRVDLYGISTSGVTGA